MKKTIIKGTGRYLPPRVVTNHDLAQWMDTSDEWIRQRTGIEKRQWAPEDIDLIIFATMSPDIYFPGSGCLLQHKLGLATTPALDIRQQCTGFVYGLEMTDAFIRSGYYNRILFVGAEVHSTAIDISTRGRDISVIFGDGAGAVCLEGVETDDPVGILATNMHAQGEFADILTVELPSTLLSPWITAEMIKKGRHHPHMDGRLVFKTAVRRLPKVAKSTMEKAGLSIDDIDLFIPHQANLRINQAFAKAMNLPEEKVFHNVQRYGNTTAASIPIALDEAIEKNLIGNGSTVVFLALGAGLLWGAVIYRFEQ